jgi:hypothetical protein
MSKYSNVAFIFKNRFAAHRAKDVVLIPFSGGEKIRVLFSFFHQTSVCVRSKNPCFPPALDWGQRLA